MMAAMNRMGTEPRWGWPQDGDGGDNDDDRMGTAPQTFPTPSPFMNWF